MAIQQILLGLGAKDYEIERSIRNDQGTADTNSGSNFSRTFGSSGNRRTFTNSIWVKKCRTPGNVGDDKFSIISAGGGGSGSSALDLYFKTNDCLRYGGGISGSSSFQLETDRVFRDPSAWYHIVTAVDTTQSTESNRVKIYINGVQETSFTTETYPSQNLELYFNFDVIHRLGSDSLWSNLSHTYGNFNGYLAEYHFIDGTALTPSSFGKTNTKTGQWVPVKYSGSYGTNGVYLNFSDNSDTTATTLGKDSSGNGNNWTPNNFGTGDSVKDSPTNNFATLRTHSTPEASGVSITEGNLKYTTGATGGAGTQNRIAISTILPTSGKWYAEVIPTSTAGNQSAGIIPYAVEESPTTDRERYNLLNFNNGDVLQNLSGSGGTLSSHASNVATNEVCQIYMDMDAKTVYYGKNGQWADGSGSWNQSTPTSGLALGNSFFNNKTGGYEGFGITIISVTGGASIDGIANFGQDSTFGGTLTAGTNTDANGIGEFKYTVPANALAICTANLPDPTIAFPNKHFGVMTYTGDGGSNRTVSDSSAVDFTPDFVWIKNRDDGDWHHLVDSVRGANKVLYSNTNDGEDTDNTNGHVNSFVANGFTVDAGASGNTNKSGEDFVSWNWKGGGSAVSNSNGTITSSISANNTAGFSIVTWSGTGSAGTIGHGLGVAPKWLVVKRRTGGAQDWFVNNGMILDDLGKYFKWNDGSNNNSSDTNVFPNTAPTSTVFSVGTDSAVNESGSTYVAYVFSEVAGYSQFGTYKGNGNSDGTFIYTGFRPAYVQAKKYSGTDAYIVFDATRDPHNLGHHRNSAAEAYAETTSVNSASSQLDIYSNGFKWRGSSNDTNGNGDDYLYLAFAESPFKYSRAR